MTRQEAINLAETKWWLHVSKEDIFYFQANESRCCCPFSVYQESADHVLGRGVYTHEFADPTSLLEEAKGENPKRSLQDIIDLIPKEKLIIIDQGD